MAKKRKPGGEGPRKRRQTRAPGPPDLSDLPDPRQLEQVMREALGRAAGGPPDSPAGQAQELLYQAYDESDAGRRQGLARQALALWPDCADAYVLLAESAPTHREALALYE